MSYNYANSLQCSKQMEYTVREKSISKSLKQELYKKNVASAEWYMKDLIRYALYGLWSNISYRAHIK